MIIPPAVIEELARQKAPQAVRRWAGAPPDWLKIIAPKQRLPSTSKLDEGEADALSLAKELSITDVLIDERDGRQIARQEGLTPLPTLAVLERAAAENFIDLAQTIAMLQKTTIRLPQEKIDEALRRDAARKHG